MSIHTFLCILILSTSVMAEPRPEFLMSEENLPSFVDPLELSGASKLPKGKSFVDKTRGLVCYDKNMNTRLLLTLKSIRPASDLRAKQAINSGYLLGFQAGADEAKIAVQNTRPPYTNAVLWLAVGAGSALVLLELIQ